MSFAQFSSQKIDCPHESSQLPGLLTDEGTPAFLVECGHWRGLTYFLTAVDAADTGDMQAATGLNITDTAKDANVGLHALRLDARALTEPQFSGIDVRLRCAAAAKENASRWVLDWQGVPGGVPDDPVQLTLPTLWQALSSHYPMGLAAANPRDRLTFVPTAMTATQAVTLRFSVHGDANGTATATRLEQIGLEDGTALTLTLGAAANTDASLPALNATTVTNPQYAWPSLRVTAAADYPFGIAAQFLAFDCKETAAVDKKQPVSPPSDWVIDGVRLKVGSFTKASFEFRLESPRPGETQPPLALDRADLAFTGTGLKAVSQDTDSGYRNLGIDRPRPLAIDIGGYTDLRIAIEERAGALDGRLLRIGASATRAEDNLVLDVIGIDSQPLAIFRASETVKIAADDLVAEYSDDGRGPPGWQFLTGTGKMTVTLPPQTRGEEMIKGRLTLPNGSVPVPVPVPGQPFDFRHGTNAVLTVDRSDIDTARVPPPWMLRQLLGLRPGFTGLKLDMAEVELTYGLSATVAGNGLRIAELDSFIGRIPFADAMADARRRFRPPVLVRPLASPDEVKGDYANKIAQWISDLGRRPSRWQVFRDVTDRRPLALGDEVQYQLRPGRQTADPFAIDQFAIASRATNDETAALGKLSKLDRKSRKPLRGGVDWPFQSANIYQELRDKPVSVAGSLDGLVFGPLGGEGGQSASFANGKTIIIASTTQGRLNALTVVRVGRIAMLWNHARHVITYERSSRRAPRYAKPPLPDHGEDTLDYQTEAYEGFMALRKVREYIEITQPRRDYPDTSTDLPLPGPCKRSSFETVVIPVKASWGRDVDQGFVMSLHGPVAPDGAKFFPEPRAFLEFARADAKGGGTIPSQLADMSQLLFFSSTREKDNGNTDSWPAWPDIDYSLHPRPRSPETPLRPRFAASRVQPDAPRADYGQSRFTLDLIANEEAANLMHGRQPGALEARICAVNFERGRPPGLDAKLQAKSLGGLQTTVAATAPVLGDLLAELRMQAAALDPLVNVEALDAFRRDAAALVAEAKGHLDKLKTAVETAGSLKVDGWESQQTRQIEAYKAGLKPVLQALGERLILTGGGDLAALRSQALAAIAEVKAQAKERISEIGFVPEQAFARMRAATVDVQATVDGELRQMRATALASVADIRLRYEQSRGNAVAALDTEYQSINADFAKALRRLTAAAQRQVTDQFGTLLARSGASSAAEQWSNAISAAVGTRADALLAAVKAVGPLTASTPPNWAALESVVKDNMVIRAAGWDALTGLLAKLPVLPTTATLLKPLRDEIDTFAAAAAATIATADDAAIHAALDKVRAAFTDTGAIGTKVLTDIPKSLSDMLTTVQTKPEWAHLGGEFDQTAALIAADVASLTAALAKPTADIAAALSTAADALTGALESAVQNVEQAVVGQIADAKGELAALIDESVQSHLELVRALAEGPVTDTLGCTRDQLGYYYSTGVQLLDVTKSSAIFNDLGAAALNGLSAMLPFDRIRDRLLLDLQNFPYASLFPDFAGLKLEYFLPDLRELEGKLTEYDWLKVKHGFDKDRMTAWTEVDIDKKLEDSPAMFELPPIALRIAQPRFKAHSRVEIGADGRIRQQVIGSIKAGWQLELSGTALVTITDGELVFDNHGKFAFNFDSDKLVMSPELQFITDALKSFLPDDEGLTILPLLPAGIGVSLSLPLPDIGTGAFTLTGITLSTHFDLLIDKSFQIRTGFWLSSPDRPFGLAVLFLGGGGWVGIDIDYTPPDTFTTRVSIGISAGAFVAVNFGFGHASAGLLFTAGVDYYRKSGAGGSGHSSVSLGLLIWGEFSLLSIASAYLRLTARIEYRDGGMTAYGRVSVSIRISIFYTLRINRDVQRVFSKPGGSSPALMASAASVAVHLLSAGPEPDSPILTATKLHFAALDI